MPVATADAKLRIATRKSPLALWQARHVASLLAAERPGLETELVTVSTAGDQAREVPVREMAGRGVFSGEVQAAVLAGKADLAVHSAKDLQPEEPPGLCLAAFCERADPRDVLVGARFADLGQGSTVATGSQRRRAQLAAAVPGLCFQDLRGNIATRLGRVPPGGAVVVALAALQRLDLQPEPMEVLSTEVMLPQVAQGAIAVECRSDDEATLRLARRADHAPTRAAVEAERAFLAAVGGGCSLPVAAYAAVVPGGGLHLEALLAAPDGSKVVRRRADGPIEDPAGLGRRVGEAVLAGGGRGLLSLLRLAP